MRWLLATAPLILGLNVQAISALAADTLLSDTAITAVDTARDPVSVDAYLYSRYVWRGVGFGGAPTVQAQMGFATGGFMAACYVAKSLNGSKAGFPNTSNLMVGYKHKGFSLVVDDYFFYDEDNLDRYADWSESTLHYIEARLRVDGDRCYALLGYNVYAGREANRDALYLEGGYKFPRQGLAVFAGGLTDKSDLNFMTSGGITNIGLTKEKQLRSGPVVTSTIIVNPSYQQVVDIPGVTRSFLTLVVGGLHEALGPLPRKCLRGLP